jgi:hypothetical protein
LCLIVVPLPPGENPFAVKINNNNNNNSIHIYLSASLPAQRPITKRARVERKIHTHVQSIIIIIIIISKT